MIKRELKVNFKSFIIWTSIILVMFLFVALIYPYIITDDTINGIDEMMKVFPKDLLKAFNMDITSISTFYGWFKSEGFMFIMLIIGIYSSFLGSSILLKETSDKTIEYLNSLPISRNKILFNKVLVGLLYSVLIVIVVCIFNYILLLYSGDFNVKEYLLLSISPVLISIPLFALNFYISLFFKKVKKTYGLSLGLVFIFYLVNVLSELSKNVEFLKYVSIYTLASVRDIIEYTKINSICIILSIIISITFIVLSYIRYNKKELL